MFRFLSGAALIIACAGLFSCQTYTSGLQQSVARADETSAVMAMNTIATAQQAYALSKGGAFGSFAQLCEGGFLDQRFNSSNPQIKDYILSMETSESSFSIKADPTRSGEAAGRHLYMDSTGPQIHVNATQPATADDPTMQP